MILIVSILICMYFIFVFYAIICVVFVLMMNAKVKEAFLFSRASRNIFTEETKHWHSLCIAL